MVHMLESTPWRYVLGVALASLGGSIAVMSVLWDPMETPVVKQLGGRLDDSMHDLLMPKRGDTLARSITWFLAACMVTALAAGRVEPLVVGLGIAGLPVPLLRRAVQRRRQHIEQQLDGWLTGLANALRAAPALGEAVRSTLPMVHGGFREELQLALRRSKLGIPLEESLHEMGTRIQSPAMSAAVTTLRIATRSGGELATMLETTAAALREMARLEGVVRTQTASGRAQAWIVSAIPLPLIAMLHYIDPTYLAPLWTTALGQVLALVAGMLWLVAALWARKIVQVDL